MPWVDNIFVAPDRSMFTVRPNGDVEIRGPGWDMKKRRGDTPMTDRPRLCKLGSVERARRIVEMIVDITYG